MKEYTKIALRAIKKDLKISEKLIEERIKIVYPNLSEEEIKNIMRDLNSFERILK